jgi:hypothetical protein
MGERALRKRAEKKGWSAEKLKAKLARREEIKDRTKGVFGKVIAPVANIALATVPGGGIVAAGIAKIPALNKVPVVKEVVEEGASQFKEKLEASANPIGAVAKDLAPAFEYIENGEWGKAAISLGLIAAAILLVVLL